MSGIQDVKTEILAGTPGGTPPVVPPPPPAATPPTPPKDEVTMSSEALKKRLDEERGKARKAFLKEHGFDDEATFQAFQKTAKEAADAKLTADEKTAKRLKELEARDARASALEKRLAKDVEKRFAALPEDVQARIIEEAGDDVEQRDAFMRVLGSVTPAPATPAAGPPAKAAPANSSNAPPAPPSGGAPTAFDQYTALEAKNPGLAAIFFNANAVAIQESAPPTK
jgi:hypothetical protein